MNQVINRLQEAYPNLTIGCTTKEIVICGVLHYKQVFNLIKDIASIKEYVLQPTNNTTKITLNEFR
jgi:hypothetical protein